MTLAVAAPVLPAEEQIRLCIKAKKKGKRAAAARESLIRSSWAFLCGVAHAYAPRCKTLTFDDLVVEGSLGIMKAIEKFDPKFGVKFLTYATGWVHAFVGRATIDDQSSFSGSEPARRRAAYSYKNDLAGLMSEGRTHEQAVKIMARRYGMTVKAVGALGALAYLPLSLHMPIVSGAIGGGDSGVLLLDTIPSADDEEARVTALDAKHRVRSALSKLDTSPREDMILSERLLSENPATLQTLGKRLGLTRERVRQIEVRLLKRLKNVLVGLPPGKGPRARKVVAPMRQNVVILAERRKGRLRSSA